MYYVACTNSNPNGDPDMGNMPRIDPQTMQGFITDGATKRRIRNYVELAHKDEPGMNIIIQQATNINRHIAEACRAGPRSCTDYLWKKPGCCAAAGYFDYSYGSCRQGERWGDRRGIYCVGRGTA